MFHKRINELLVTCKWKKEIILPDNAKTCIITEIKIFIILTLTMKDMHDGMQYLYGYYEKTTQIIIEGIIVH